MAKSNYSDKVKADVIAYYHATNATLQEVGAAFGIPWQTVQSWTSGRKGVNDDITKDVKIVTGSIADKLEALIHKMVDAADGKIDTAGLAATMTSTGIAIDRMRLLREQSTSITQELSTEEAEKEAQDLAQKVILRLVEGRKSA